MPKGAVDGRQFSRCLEDVAQELDVDEVLTRRDVDSLLSDIGDGRRIRVEDLLQECGLDNYDENDDYPTTSKKYPRTPGRARTPARFRRRFRGRRRRTTAYKAHASESRRPRSRIGSSRKCSIASARHYGSARCAMGVLPDGRL